MREARAASSIPDCVATQLALGGSFARVDNARFVVLLDRGVDNPLPDEIWHAAMFGVGSGSVLVAVPAARAVHARPATQLTVPLHWPLQSLATLQVLIEMKLKPQFRAKTPHDLAASTASPTALAARPQANNIVQLEFPFPDQDRAISP